MSLATIIPNLEVEPLNYDGYSDDESFHMDNTLEEGELNPHEEKKQEIYWDNVRAKQPIIGVLTFSFIRKTPKEYAISTLTHYIKGQCVENWKEKLDKQVQNLNITQLYVAGFNQLQIIRDWIEYIPVYTIPCKIPIKPQKCHNCHKYGCCMFKANKMLKEMFKNTFNLNCE